MSVYGKGIDDSIMYRKLDCRARGHLSPSRGDLELPERVGVRPGWLVSVIWRDHRQGCHGRGNKIVS